ncbi:hypothetical protein [Aurantibacillus circumpalustris]|uniref:hypothetical protein n=1 Tax=Aurantibacillus circumpalustris TaxID=3036359 RepID=UPI00295A5A52|nr:hypothetical protein [Aurantibacillus circumpalustris]
MKKLITLFVLIAAVSCNSSSEKAAATKTKIVCGDSIEQEMFDENGNSIMVRVAGKCDTIVVNEE